MTLPFSSLSLRKDLTFVSAPFPFDLLLPLTLRHADRQVEVALCLAAVGHEELRSRRYDFLHLQELERLAAMNAERRSGDFLIGRYVCKRALAHLLPSLDVREVCVAPGVFGQPVLKSEGHLGLQVSISHADGIGAAIASPEIHPMALDVEQYAEGSCAAIASQLTSAELDLLDTLALPRVKGMTALWTMKEALSKVLRCGLTVPFTLLEVDRLEPPL